MKRLGTVRIDTERLALRRFMESDIDDAYSNYGSDPEVGRYINFTPCDTLEGTREFIHIHLKKYMEDPDFYGWALTLDGVVIGTVSLFEVDLFNESCEIGYSLGSRWCGKGYMTEAVSAVIDFAIHDLQMHRVQATCHPDNTASQRILEKVGMRFEGVMRDSQKNKDGSFTDLRLYAIISEDCCESPE